jgi:hypothetical protein
MGHNDNDQPVTHPLNSKAMEAESPRAKARREAREREVRDQDRTERDQEPVSDVSPHPDPQG